MSISKSKGVILCSLIGGLAALSGCSDSDPANVSFEQIDTSTVPNNIISNSDFSASDTELPGWDRVVEVSNGTYAEFTLVPAMGGGSTSSKTSSVASAPASSQGGRRLKASIIDVEAESLPEDVVVGPTSVSVKPGQAYGVAAQVQGPTCGLTRFVVNPEGNTDPDNYLASQDVFLTGQPQLAEFYFQVPEGVTSVDMPVQMGFADNVSGEFFIDRIVAIPLPVLPRVQEGNVANNSDFEESDTEISVDGSWGQAGTGATFLLYTVPEDAQSGNNSVKIVFDETVGGGDPWDIEAGPAGVPTVSGWTYEFSAWYKGEPGAVVNFLVQNPNDYTVFAQQRVETFTSEWQEVRFEATVTGTNEVRLFAQYNFSENAEKTIYIDNIRFIPPATCPYAATAPNMVSTNPALFEYNHAVNGGLEADPSETVGWAITAVNGAAAQFDVQTVGEEFNRTLVSSGYRSLRATVETVTNTPEDIQVGPQNLYVVPGETYIYSGFIRGPVGTQASLTSTLADSSSTSMEGVLVPLNNLWHQITFDFTVPSNAPTLTAEELAEAGFAEDDVLATLNMVVNLGYPENIGKHIYLDDFTLLPNAIRNGDLEESADTAQGWATNSASNYATFNLDNTEAHTGDNSLRVSFNLSAAAMAERPDGASEDDPPVFLMELDDVWAGVENIPVLGGRKYYVSARFNGDAGARVKLLLISTDGATEFGSESGEDGDEDGQPDGVELTGGWQEVTFAANVPEGVEEVSLIAQMGYPTNATRTINLDTFRLVSQIPPVPKAKANLVENSGFETGDAIGWNGNGATIAVVDTADGVYSGRYALHVTERTANWASAQYDLTDVGLEPGSHYFASVWVKVDGTESDTLGLTLQIDYEGDADDTDYFPIVNSGDVDTLEWTRLSRVFTFAPAEGKTVTSIKVYVEATEADTNYYIDDLFVTKVFNTNGGFETGETSAWEASGSAALTVTSTDVRSGSYAVHVTGRTDTWNSAQSDMRNIGLEAGRTYLISAWVKTDGTTAETIKMTMEYVDDGESPQYRTLAQSSDTLEWVQLSNIYTHRPEGDVSTLKVYFEAASTTGSYFVDDLIVTEYVPPITLITNGDLELGDSTGWVASGGATSIAVVQWPQGGAHSGFYGLHVTERSDNWHSAQYPLQQLELEPGTSYRASVWVKTASETAVTDNMSLTFLLKDGDGDHYITVASGAVTADDWVQLAGVFDYAPVGTVTDVRLYVEAAGKETSYFVDDLVVAPNFAFNGGLEVSSTEHLGWVNSGDAQLSVSETSYEGAHSLFVTGRTALWNSAQQDLTSSGMEPGKTYDISAWVKIDGDTPSVIKMTMESRLAGAEGSTYTFLDGTTDTADWVKLSARYVFGYEEMPEIFKVYFEADEQDEGNDPPVFSAFYVDSLVITEVEETYTH